MLNLAHSHDYFYFVLISFVFDVLYFEWYWINVSDGKKRFFGGDFCQTETNRKTPKKTMYRSLITEFQYRTAYIPEWIHTLLLHTWFPWVFLQQQAGQSGGRSQGYAKKMHGFIHIWTYSSGVQTCSVFKRTSGFIMRSTQIFVHESRWKLKWSETDLGLLIYLYLCWLLSRLF